MHLLFARLGDDWQTSFNLGNLLLINARPYLLIRNGCYVLLDFCSSAQGQKRMTSIRTLSISDASLINVLSASTFMHYLIGRLHSNNRLSRLPQFCYNRFLLFQNDDGSGTSGSGSRGVSLIKLISIQLLFLKYF